MDLAIVCLFVWSTQLFAIGEVSKEIIVVFKMIRVSFKIVKVAIICLLNFLLTHLYM